MLHYGSVGRVQSKESYFLFKFSYVTYFVVFHKKNCVFIFSLPFFDKVSNCRNRFSVRNRNWYKEIVSETVCMELFFEIFFYIFKTFIAITAITWEKLKDWQNLILQNHGNLCMQAMKTCTWFQKLELRYKIFTYSQDFHCLPAGISLIQKKTER